LTLRGVLCVGVGFLGAYTTFSTFTYETMRLVESDDAPIAAGYVAASLAAGMLAMLPAVGRSF
jgi:CrcB protein